MNNQKELILIGNQTREYPTFKSTQKSTFAIYECFCGNEFKAMVENVKNKKIKSCGCLSYKAKYINTDKTKRLKLFNVLNSMIQRCHKQNNKQYKDYGGRGITVCDEWKNNYLSFYNWAIKNGYEIGLKIDRINNDGNYEPSNCRWTNQNIQSRNTRKIIITNTSGYRGVSNGKTIGKFLAKITVNNKNIHIGTYESNIEAAKAYDNYVIDNNLEHTKNF